MTFWQCSISKSTCSWRAVSDVSRSICNEADSTSSELLNVIPRNEFFNQRNRNRSQVEIGTVGTLPNRCHVSFFQTFLDRSRSVGARIVHLKMKVTESNRLGSERSPKISSSPQILDHNLSINCDTMGQCCHRKAFIGSESHHEKRLLPCHETLSDHLSSWLIFAQPSFVLGLRSMNIPWYPRLVLNSVEVVPVFLHAK